MKTSLKKDRFAITTLKIGIFQHFSFIKWTNIFLKGNVIAKEVITYIYWHINQIKTVKQSIILQTRQQKIAFWRFYNALLTFYLKLPHPLWRLTACQGNMLVTSFFHILIAFTLIYYPILTNVTYTWKHVWNRTGLPSQH